MSGAVRVVHLVWAPLGSALLAAFMGSYRAHDAGREHRLTLLFNGFAPGQDRGPWLSQLDGVAYEEIVLNRPRLDLAAYRLVIDELAEETVCFLNSYTEIECDNWLRWLARPLDTPGVGLVGASGSFESGWDTAPLRLRRLLRGGFEPFPNPHIRTNAFALRVGLARELDWPLPRRKRDAHLLESGRHGLTRQVLARGLQAVVVGCDGCGYASERWRESATFRSGGQTNALITDNRTRQYAQASPQLRAALERMCWGVAD